MKKLKNGSYTALMSVIVIVAAIILNLIFGQLPSSITEIDLSSTQIYTISDTSKELLADLEHDITLYVIGESNSIDTRISTFIDRYASLSDKIKVVKIDPVLHPATVTSLGAESDSILVSCEDTGKTELISFNDILVSSYSYYSYSYSYTEFDGEGQLTSAIAAVTNEVSKKIYTLSGHNESSLTTCASEMLDKNGMEVDSINILLDQGIPEDCDLLICYAPTSDLSSDEYVQILNYMNQGGNFMLIVGTQEKSLPNFEALMEVYGLKFVNEQGYLADVERYYMNTPYYFFPVNDTSHEIMSGITSSDMCLLIDATALAKTDEIPDGVTVETFLKTSSNGVMVTADSQDYGTYMVGATSYREAVPEVVTGNSLVGDVEDETKPEIEEQTTDIDETDAADETTDTEEIEDTEETIDTEAEEEETVISKLVVISAPSIISDQITDVSNVDVFINAVSWNFDDVQVVSVESKSLQENYNTIYNGGMYSVIFIVIVPAALVLIGLVVWIRRRKR
ncbi:MAG: Gldg family protein [Lachnospiraceae bacterium]